MRQPGDTTKARAGSFSYDDGDQYTIFKCVNNQYLSVGRE